MIHSLYEMPKVSIRDPEPYQCRRRFEVQTRHHTNPTGRHAGRQDSGARGEVSTKGNHTMRYTCQSSKFSHSTAIREKSKPDEQIPVAQCTIGELRWHIERQFKPGMTWENRERWVLTHIIPIYAIDRSQPDALQRFNHWSNIKPQWTHGGKRRDMPIHHPEYDILRMISPHDTHLDAHGIAQLNPGVIPYKEPAK